MRVITGASSGELLTSATLFSAFCSSLSSSGHRKRAFHPKLLHVWEHRPLSRRILLYRHVARKYRAFFVVVHFIHVLVSPGRRVFLGACSRITQLRVAASANMTEQMRLAC